jgi:hypothetical protein
MFSNMRQRAPKAHQAKASPARENLAKQNSSWEITSDDGLGDYGVGGLEATNSSKSSSIPLYNPLHYQSQDSSIAPAPCTNPLSWDNVIEAKNVNLAHLQGKDILIAGRPLGHTLSDGFIGLRNTHLPSLAPAFIPDSKYQAYLLGRSKQKRTSAIDKICMAKFCAHFSIIAAMFLIFVGILIDRQPMYLQGILPKHIQYTTGDRKPQVFFATDIPDRLEQASHAYRAAFLYFLTACLSLGYAYNAQWWFKSKWHNYHDIPDNDSTIPAFHNGGREVGILPTKQQRQAYNARLQSMSVAVHRAALYIASVWPRRRNRRHKFSGAKDV